MTEIADEVACMKERSARILKCIWQAWYPLPVYLCMIDIVSLVAAAAGGAAGDGQELIGTMLAAVIMAVLLFGPYRATAGSVQAISSRRYKAAALVILVGISACLLFNHLFILLGFTSASYQQAQEMLYAPDPMIQFLAIGVFIPFTEELVFRGFGFWRMRRICTFTPAAIFSSLCFGVFHGNIVQGVYGFCLGFILAWVFEVYHRIWAPVLLHMTANITSLLLTWLAPGSGADAGPLPALTVVLLSGVFMLFGIYRIRGEDGRMI